jgi:hypothetical protein
MEFIVKSEYTELFYQAFIVDPLLEVTIEELRIPLIKKLLKTFDLRLNDVRFDVQSISNNYIHFSKYYGPTLFDVSFGLEEVSAKMTMPTDEAQVQKLFGSLAQFLKDSRLSRQKMDIKRQFSTKENAESFVRSLNPYMPDNFQKHVFGSGVVYHLKNSEHDLVSYILISNSLFVKDGIYLSIENNFFPNKYDFEQAFVIAKGQHDFILKELNLRIER